MTFDIVILTSKNKLKKRIQWDSFKDSLPASASILARNWRLWLVIWADQSELVTHVYYLKPMIGALKLLLSVKDLFISFLKILHNNTVRICLFIRNLKRKWIRFYYCLQFRNPKLKSNMTFSFLDHRKIFSLLAFQNNFQNTFPHFHLFNLFTWIFDLTSEFYLFLSFFIFVYYHRNSLWFQI